MKRESLLKRLFKKKPDESEINTLREYSYPDREGSEPGKKRAEEKENPYVDSGHEEKGISGYSTDSEEKETGKAEGVETKSTALAEREETRKEDVLREEKILTPKEETSLRLSEGVSELSSLLKNINTKLDDQREFREEIASHIRALPEIVRKIPEATQEQTEVLRTMTSQMEQQSKATQSFMESFKALPEVLKELPETARLQADVMRKMAEEIGNQNANMITSLNEINNTSKGTMASFKSGQNKALNIFYRAQKETLIAFKRSQEEQARQFQRFIQSALKSNSKMLLIFFLALMIVIASAFVVHFVVLN